MKEKISLYLVATVKRIGALWVGLLVSLVPLYVIRASLLHDNDLRFTVECTATSAIVLITAALFLFFLYRRDDHAAKLERKEILRLVLIPTLIHFLICFITAFTQNLIVISTGMGYYFINLLEPDAHSVADLSAGAQILASLIVTPFPAVGVWLGCLSARKQRQKEVAELHSKSH